jgi:hypothetical protein
LTAVVCTPAPIRHGWNADMQQKTVPMLTDSAPLARN